MKHLLNILLIFFLLPVPNKLLAQCTRKGAIDVNIGTGLSSTLFGSGRRALLPPIGLSLDYGLDERLSLGTFLGLNYGRLKSSSDRKRFLTFGIRGVYHFDLDIDVDRLETYAGLMAGYNIGSSFEERRRIDILSSPFTRRLTYRVFVGARYHLSDNWGVFAELGNGATFFQAGLTMRLCRVDRSSEPKYVKSTSVKTFY